MIDGESVMVDAVLAVARKLALENKELRRQLVTAQNERDTWRARCGQ